jgi:hypothetical protein
MVDLPLSRMPIGGAGKGGGLFYGSGNLAPGLGWLRRWKDLMLSHLHPEFRSAF